MSLLPANLRFRYYLKWIIGSVIIREISVSLLQGRKQEQNPKLTKCGKKNWGGACIRKTSDKQSPNNVPLMTDIGGFWTTFTGWFFALLFEDFHRQLSGYCMLCFPTAHPHTACSHLTCKLSSAYFCLSTQRSIYSPYFFNFLRLLKTLREWRPLPPPPPPPCLAC